MKKVTEKLIFNAIRELQESGVWDSFGIPEISVERPKDVSHGDWTTNISFVLAKELKKAPLEIAGQLSEKMTDIASEEYSQIEAVAPGYVNVRASETVGSQELQKILFQKDGYGQNEKLKEQKIVVEYTQPNPFKPFHIGHLMSNTIGESISRILSFSGADVVRVNYQGDIGPHVAKALWGLSDLGYAPDDINRIGEAYAHGHKMSEESDDIKSAIQKINVQIYSGEDSDLMKLYNQGRQVTLDRFEELYAVLGTRFDEYFFESETWKEGERIVRENIGEIFEESDGAIIFPGEKYGLHTRVFITAEGLPTYEAKEIGLAMLKKEKCPADQYVTTTAVEQEDYFKVVKKALDLIDPTFEGHITHVAHGMMQLASGKMSSREGNVITGESLIADAQSVAREKMSERAEDDIIDDTVDAIAVAGIKFGILKQKFGKNIAYDADTALSFEGDSGPYIQYTYARCQSVLEKAKDSGISENYDHTDADGRELEKMLVQFGEYVERAVDDYAAHHISNYLLQAVHMYNTYYAKNVIVDMEHPDVSGYRVALTRATSHIIKNGMQLLGISVPGKM